MVYPEDTSETGADGTASQSDKSSMPKEDSNSSKAGPSGASNQDESPMVREVFSMFKNYLEVKLEEKGRQLETKSKLDKQVTQMKFKGNQKQFEHNAQIDSVFNRIRSANASESKDVDDLVNEGKELTRKRQKLIRIADKSVDDWKVVDEYISDELASGSEVLVLSTGATVTVPNVIRIMIPQRIVQQYTNFCKETNFKPFSERTMLRILSACSASVRKSLQGLDYFAADGSKAFEDLAEVVKDLSTKGPEQEWEKSVQDSLKAAKMYLKGAYKVFFFFLNYTIYFVYMYEVYIFA